MGKRRSFETPSSRGTWVRLSVCMTTATRCGGLEASAAVPETVDRSELGERPHPGPAPGGRPSSHHRMLVTANSDVLDLRLARRYDRGQRLHFSRQRTGSTVVVMLSGLRLGPVGVACDRS